MGRLEQPWQDKNLLYRRDKPNEPTNLFYLYSLSSPFTSVSTVRRRPPLSSLSDTYSYPILGIFVQLKFEYLVCFNIDFCIFRY
jgi:hypothetical protein